MNWAYPIAIAFTLIPLATFLLKLWIVKRPYKSYKNDLHPVTKGYSISQPSGSKVNENDFS